MTLNEDTLSFIREHRRNDVRSLALQARKYPKVDMPAAITQIAGWQIAKEKVPTWAGIDGILYPVHLSMEQCSSEITARYKAEIVATETCKRHDTFTDLTGGFGIDCAFLSACFKQATYVERQQTLCDIASHNFHLLDSCHITVCNKDSVQHLQSMQPVDWIFIDPARRDGHGEDCSYQRLRTGCSSTRRTSAPKSKACLGKTITHARPYPRRERFEACTRGAYHFCKQ